HVQRARRVGEHHEDVELGLAPVFGDAKEPGLLPGVTPLRLDCLRIVDGSDSPGHVRKGLVEPTRFELVTYCMPCSRAPSCATAPLVLSRASSLSGEFATLRQAPVTPPSIHKSVVV